MKSLFRCFIGFTVLILISAVCFAQPPVSILLELDNDYYRLGEDVLANIRVSNATGSELLINQEFPDTVFIQEVSVIDPSGRRSSSVKLVLPPEKELDVSPVPVILRGGRSVPVMAWARLGPDWQDETGWQNLSDYHPSMDLPGWYATYLQVDIMTFKPADPGSIGNFEYQGVVKSNTVYFYKEGATPIKVIPNKWRLKWQDDKKKSKQIKVQIWPEDGRTVDDYLMESIELNNFAASRLKKTPSKIEAYFDANLAIESLGNAEENQWYPVVLSGQLINGQFFGGAQKIKIVQ